MQTMYLMIVSWMLRYYISTALMCCPAYISFRISMQRKPLKPSGRNLQKTSGIFISENGINEKRNGSSSIIALLSWTTIVCWNLTMIGVIYFMMGKAGSLYNPSLILSFSLKRNKGDSHWKSILLYKRETGLI